MVKRIALLLAVIAVAVPAAALADDGKGGRLASVEQRIDARFQHFASRCLVANAPERCAHVADRIVTRLDRLQRRIGHVEAAIKERCGQANPPERCAHAGDLIAKLDALKAKLAGYVSQIKAKYPNAGSGQG